MDPTNRVMLQVDANQIEKANDMFSTLMGDDVVPRRDFIKANALDVQNLDI
jgi:DNA gyrase subunit B